MQHHILTTLLLTAVLLTPGLTGTTAVAQQQPASPAQLAALQSQNAALEAQQEADRSERERLRGALANLPAKIQELQALENLLARAAQNPALVAGQAWAQGKPPAVVIGEALTRNVDVRNQINTAQALQVAVPMRIAEIDNAIAQRQDQIAQLERTIAYLRNPRQADLENEQARLRDLQNRPAPRDPFDQRALQQDIDATDRRIKQLQEGFQQGGTSRGDPTTAPSQGSYNAPTGGAGTGPQSQLPLGAYGGGFMGTPSVYGSPLPPRWTDLQPPSASPRHSGGSSGSQHAGGSSPASATPAAGGTTSTGATCGPATSCTCAGGGKGHIPCDKSMGACHCGGG